MFRKVFIYFVLFRKVFIFYVLFRKVFIYCVLFRKVFIYCVLFRKVCVGSEPLKLKSPLKPPPRPKSRVRDTIKLFDAKYKVGRGPRPPTKPRPITSPKTGGGEGMAGDSMEDKYK